VRLLFLHAHALLVDVCTGPKPVPVPVPFMQSLKLAFFDTCFTFTCQLLQFHSYIRCITICKPVKKLCSEQTCCKLIGHAVGKQGALHHIHISLQLMKPWKDT
jgi:hypothetical protein